MHCERSLTLGLFLLRNERPADVEHAPDSVGHAGESLLNRILRLHSARSARTGLLGFRLGRDGRFGLQMAAQDAGLDLRQGYEGRETV